MSNIFDPENRYSDRKDLDTEFPIGNYVLEGATVSLAKVTSDESRLWTITLARVDRKDRSARSLIVADDQYGTVPLLQAQQYVYTTGQQLDGVEPPRRSNPVWGVAISPSQDSAAQTFVQIAWGSGAAADPNRLLAHWPSQGGTITVAGQYVEVWGQAGVLVSESLVPEPGSVPSLKAQIVPAAYAPSIDSNELSMTQNVDVKPASGARVFYADGVAVAPGFQCTNNVGLFYTNVAVRGALAVTPLVCAGWNAQLRTADGAPHKLYIYKTPGGAGLPDGAAVTDNSKIVTSGALWDVIDEPGSVAILIDGGGCTFAQLDAAIGTSTLITLIQGSDNPTYQVAPTGGTFTVASNYVAAIADSLGMVGTATVLAPTTGAAVYVPDFARRVFVALLRQAPDEGFRTPLAGPLPQQIVFYDDNGRVCGAITQGGATGQPLDWLPVPGPAVMMGVYTTPDDAESIATIHWRVAP